MLPATRRGLSFWDKTLYSLIEIEEHFGGTYTYVVHVLVPPSRKST